MIGILLTFNVVDVVAFTVVVVVEVVEVVVATVGIVTIAPGLLFVDEFPRSKKPRISPALMRSAMAVEILATVAFF
jgi:hypothetical protein